MAEEFYTNNFELEEQWSDYGIGDPYVLRYNGPLLSFTPVPRMAFQEFGYGYLKICQLVIRRICHRGACYNHRIRSRSSLPNGKFYMYTSPAGNGHYVLTSKQTRWGLSELQTDNFGMTIDGSVFIDDDGQWYFTHAGTQGIIGHAMHDPLNVSPRTDTQCLPWSLDGRFHDFQT